MNTISERSNVKFVWIECLQCRHRDFRTIITGSNQEITKKIKQLKYVHNVNKSCKIENIIILESE